jgi:hypothetical protein
VKLHIEEYSLWARVWTGYRFRVTSFTEEVAWDGQSVTIANELLDGRPVRLHHSLNPLNPEIREWLETSIPYSKWNLEQPEYLGDKLIGLLFKRKQDVVMFKLAWGGR